MHLLMCSVNLSGSFFLFFLLLLFSFFLFSHFFVSSFCFSHFSSFFTVFLFFWKKSFIAYFWFPFPFFPFYFSLFSFFLFVSCPVFFFFLFIYFSPFWYFFSKKSWWLFPSASPLLGWRRSTGTPQLSSPPLPFSPRPAGPWKPIKQPEAFSRPGRAPVILIATVQARTAMNITSQ